MLPEPDNQIDGMDESKDPEQTAGMLPISEEEQPRTKDQAPKTEPLTEHMDSEDDSQLSANILSILTED